MAHQKPYLLSSVTSFDKFHILRERWYKCDEKHIFENVSLSIQKAQYGDQWYQLVLGDHMVGQSSLLSLQLVHFYFHDNCIHYKSSCGKNVWSSI